MGGKSSSSSTSTTKNFASNYAGDINGIAVGSGASTGDIVVTDQGAVESSFDFAKDVGNKALDVGGGLASQSLDNAARLSEQAMGSVTSQAGTNANYMRDMASQIGELAKSFQSQGESDKNKVYMYMGGAGLVAIVLVVLLMNKGKK